MPLALALAFLLLRPYPSGRVEASARTSDLSPSATAPSQRPDVPLGFSPSSFENERRCEQRYQELIESRQCERYLGRLTTEPHVAGTQGDRRVSEFIADEFRRDGIDTEVVEYNVLLSYPKTASLELTVPEHVTLAHPEPPIRGDKATQVADPLAHLPWNAYSPSADISAPVIYANYGTPDDYDRLAKSGVSVRGRIVLVRYFHGYRGGKSLEAEKRGVAGILIYSDPAEDGAKQGRVYPRGPWGPLSHFQRGAVVYDFIVPGDPLTPGWPSISGTRRIPEAESRILPKIPMMPLSAADASEILSRLRGPEAPSDWQGGLPFTYRMGDGTAQVHLALAIESRVTPIWDVIGRIPGSDEPDKLVLLSNHHDAWVYGAVDPASGTAAMLETARAFGELLRQGFRPRRTLLFGSWDAEEYTLTGSTEWGEQYENDLKKNTVVCLNVDSATSGRHLSVSLVPSLLRAAIEAAQAVRDPETGRSLYDRWEAEKGALNVRSYAVRGAAGSAVPFGILGGGSDFMVFLQHDGVPSADLSFDGPYGVYHSLYDDFDWMKRFGDPGFHYHAAMARLWGILALRFANADLEPLDYSAYATEIEAYLTGLKPNAPPEFANQVIPRLIDRCRRWREVATAVEAGLDAWRSGPIPPVTPSAAQVNTCLAAEERALLDPGGVPGRPWFRHLIYAPLPSYEAETLPGLREALADHDLERAREQAGRLEEALGRAIDACSSVSPPGSSKKQ